MATHHRSGPPYGQRPHYGQQPEFFQPPQPGDYRGHYDPQQPWLRPGRPPGRNRRGAPPPRRHRTRNFILGIVGAFLLIIVIAAVASSGNQNNNAATSAQGNTQQPAGQHNASSPAPAQTSLPPAAPQYTASHRQSITAAQGYLSSGMGFSYQGLIDQLDSASGDGFSVADATFAVNHVQADWKAQAVISAKGYMSSGMGFSCASLVQQLDSPDGNQFTQAQAKYAASQVGLRNC